VEKTSAPSNSLLESQLKKEVRISKLFFQLENQIFESNLAGEVRENW
jgi:hypothetical protein